MVGVEGVELDGGGWRVEGGPRLLANSDRKIDLVECILLQRSSAKLHPDVFHARQELLEARK